MNRNERVQPMKTHAHSIKHAWEVKTKNIHMHTHTRDSRPNCSRIDAIFFLISFEQNKTTTSTKRILPAVFVTLFFFSSLDLNFYYDLLLFLFFFPPFICTFFWLLLARYTYTDFDFILLSDSFLCWHTRPAYEASCFYCAPFGRFMASPMKINFQGMLLYITWMCVWCAVHWPTIDYPIVCRCVCVCVWISGSYYFCIHFILFLACFILSMCMLFTL